MSKVELQAKVDALDGEIKFFKCLYEGVSLPCPPLAGLLEEQTCVLIGNVKNPGDLQYWVLEAL